MSKAKSWKEQIEEAEAELKRLRDGKGSSEEITKKALEVRDLKKQQAAEAEAEARPEKPEDNKKFVAQNLKSGLTK